MNMRQSQPKIKTPELLPLEGPTRRAFMTALAAVGVGTVAATPAESKTYAVNIGGDLAGQIAHHVAEIERLLQDSAPDDVTLSGVQWCTKRDGSFWASGHWNNPNGDPYDYQLAHYRPIKGWWIQANPQIVGGSI